MIIPPTIANENLPRLVGALLDAEHWLKEECDSQEISITTAYRAIRTIARWKQIWKNELEASSDTVSFTDFVRLCRQAPPSFLIDGLLTLYNALVESAQLTGDVTFWNEGGLGKEAQYIGSQTIQSTWWSFQPFLRKWADRENLAIRTVLDDTFDVLMEEARRIDAFGVIEPKASLLRNMRIYVFGEQ